MPRRTCLIGASLAGLAALLLLISIGLAPAQPGGKKVALLVGINRYHHTALNQPRPLEFAEKDVTQAAAELKKAGYDVVVLTGDKATLTTIRNALADVRKRPGAEGILLIGLAGHGLQPEGSRDAYFCPYDADQRVVAQTDPNQDPWDYRTLLPLSEVLAHLKAATAGTRVLLMDACRNDPTSGRGRGVGTGLNVGDFPRNTAVLLSCSEGQRSYEDKAWGGGHGAFFYHILEGLRGKAADARGRVTADDLWRYVRDEVPAQVARVIGGGVEQRPFRLITGDVDLRVAAVDRRAPLGKPALLQAPFGATEARQAQQAWAQYLSRPAAEAFDLGSGVQLEVVLIPPGTFRMGSPDDDQEAQNDEKPAHEVTLSQPFWLGKYEVTVGQFRRFVSDTGYRTEAETDGKGNGFSELKGVWERGYQYTWKNPGYPQTEAHPVGNVTWHDAKAFCTWLGQKVGANVRLCREAEWEYSCRAGAMTRYLSGDDAAGLQKVANVADASLKAKCKDASWAQAWGDGHAFAAPVGRFAGNAFGLHDLHGNVWEWCEDWYDKDYYRDSPTEDPAGPGAGADRVIRGGSFFHDARDCRAAVRDHGEPSLRFGNYGFRVLLAR
jgi:formylglycine-generating enzyme required for sulfatase activity